MAVGGQRHAPIGFTPVKETRYPLYMRLVGPQGRSGRVRKISSPLVFNPRTIQAVATHLRRWEWSPGHPSCSDWATNRAATCWIWGSHSGVAEG